MSKSDNLDGDEVSIDGFLTALNDCETTYDIFRILRKICKAFEFNSFVAMRLPPNSAVTLDEVVIVTNWNPEMIRAYDSLNLLSTSPVISRLSQSTLPIRWYANVSNGERTGEVAKQSKELFHEFDFISGIYFPTTDHRGNRGAIGYSSPKETLIEDQFPELYYLSQHIYEALIRIEGTAEIKRDILTDREIECLSWAAVGKTSAETSVILGISENTVNHYFTNAATKLDTVNKAHTVAKALRTGLLEQ
ncbi:MAG: LuxR family transcriptional regulator [Pseudomonadota bacterium]